MPWQEQEQPRAVSRNSPRVLIGDHEAVMQSLTLDQALNRPARATLTASGLPLELATGDEVRIEFDGLWFNLAVEEFLIVPDSRDDDVGKGWVSLVDPIYQATVFDREAYCADDGVTLIDVAASRVSIEASTKLSCEQFPNVTVDGISVTALIDDLCARHAGVWFRRNLRLDNGPMLIGPLDGREAEYQEPIEISRTTHGRSVTLQALGFPAPGDRVRLVDGFSGPVTSLRIEAIAGELPTIQLDVGDPPPARRHRATGSVDCDAVVTQLEPPAVEYCGGQTSHTARGELYSRRLDEGRFKEMLPVKVGDSMLIRLPVGGVETSKLRLLPYSSHEPSDSYALTAARFDLETDNTFITAKQKVECHVGECFAIDSVE